ncbi:MAG: hypothetical protein U0746_02100 [Gemmataceae bacterium]
MNLTTGRAKLHEAYKVLQAHWEETRAGWNDAACRPFEENHMEPLGPAVAAALRATDRLSAVLVQMRNECD